MQTGLFVFSLRLVLSNVIRLWFVLSVTSSGGAVKRFEENIPFQEYAHKRLSYRQIQNSNLLRKEENIICSYLLIHFIFIYTYENYRFIEI